MSRSCVQRWVQRNDNKYIQHWYDIVWDMKFVDVKKELSYLDPIPHLKNDVKVDYDHLRKGVTTLNKCTKIPPGKKTKLERQFPEKYKQACLKGGKPRKYMCHKSMCRSVKS